MTTEPVIQTLSVLRACLSNGDYVALAELVDQLKTETSALSLLDDVSLANLRENAAQTMACVEAAYAGFRAAQRRIEEVTASPTFGTYDRQGTRLSLSSSVKSTRRY